MMRTTSTRAQESHPSHREITVGGVAIRIPVEKKNRVLFRLAATIYSRSFSLRPAAQFSHTANNYGGKKKKQERELASLFPFTIALLTFGGYTP